MFKEKISETLLNVANKREKVDTLINMLLSPEADKLDIADKLAMQAFCCMLLADSTRKVMQIKQYLKEYCEYINKAFSIHPESYVCHLIRVLVELNLHNVDFNSHIQEDTDFLKAYHEETEPAYQELVDYALSNT